MTKRELQDTVLAVPGVDAVEVSDSLGWVLVDIEVYGRRADFSINSICQVLRNTVAAGVLWVVIAHRWRWRWLRRVIPGRFMMVDSLGRMTK